MMNPKVPLTEKKLYKDYLLTLLSIAFTEKASLKYSLEDLVAIKAISLGIEKEKAENDAHRIMNLYQATLLLLDKVAENDFEM